MAGEEAANQDSELLCLEAEHYTLVVWAKGLDKSQRQLTKTMQARGKLLPETRVLLAPELLLKEFDQAIAQYPLAAPIFFENKYYDIEFIFNDDSFSLNPRVEHRLRSVEESFHYSPRTRSLRATVNTANDIGWFKLDLLFTKDTGRPVRQSFSFEILPIKMDMAADVEVMNAAIDEVFPLWRYSLAEKTQHSLRAVKKPQPEFLLHWLAQFETLFAGFQEGLKHVVNAPHSRLLSHQCQIPMAKLKGKLSCRIEREVAEACANKQFDRRFSVAKKTLSVDTPENRFIKSVVQSTVKKLDIICRAALADGKKPDKIRLSDSFLNKLQSWHQGASAIACQPLFKEVGRFSGLQRESLVLQQKPGYAKVYKVWQQLKWHLELLGDSSLLSVKNIAELYEIWCFLEIRQIIRDLGFDELESKHVSLVSNGLELGLKDGMKGAFKFSRSDGVSLRLVHEPRFNRRGAELRTWTTEQKPDIFLEAKFPGGEEIVWLFDAKYRIETPPDNADDSAPDTVPADAINQMHRYRDAVIHIRKREDHSLGQKSRPVFGAFALYPGFFDQQRQSNPYKAEIAEVGIGAFSLLPSADGNGSYWLKSFLQDKLGRPYSKTSVDQYYVEEAPRIAYRGTQVQRFDDLTVIANQLGPGRANDYINAFESGEAGFYHTKQLAFKRQNIEQHIVCEARYLAVATNCSSGGREVVYIYPIEKVERLKRVSITEEQAGTSAKIRAPEEIYWLFTLGKSMRLSSPTILSAARSFELKLARRQDLQVCQDWDALPEQYISVKN